MAPTRPLSFKKSNGLELPNADVLSLFRHTTCSASASAHYNALKNRKTYTYSDFRKIPKTPIIHLLLLSSSVQTTYREIGDSNCSVSFTKIIYAGACMILDTPNLHTSSQSRQIPCFASLEALVLTPFSCLLMRSYFRVMCDSAPVSCLGSSVGSS